MIMPHPCSSGSGYWGLFFKSHDFFSKWKNHQFQSQSWISEISAIYLIRILVWKANIFGTPLRFQNAFILVLSIKYFFRIKRGALKRRQKTSGGSCKDCGSNFESYASLTYHISRVHEDKKPNECPNCGRFFAINSSSSVMKMNLIRHLHSCGNPGGNPKPTSRVERVFYCSLCPKRFFKESYIKLHIKRYVFFLMKANEKIVAYMISRKIIHSKYSRQIFQSISS